MKPIYLIDGARSPFLKAKDSPGPFSASDLATQVGRGLLLRQSFQASDLTEVILGCAAPSVDETNIARVVALRVGGGNKVIGHTVMRNCASGMQALDNAMANIETGRSELVLAGGVDALSRTPLLFSDGLVRVFGALNRAKTPLQKIKALSSIKLKDLAPTISLLRGLTDPVVKLSMGQTAENLAHRFGIDRATMDEFSQRSHAKAIAAGKDPTVIPLVDQKGEVYDSDTGVRSDATLERLAKLRPVFDKFGQVTAGNSSQITDGAALLLLASEAAIERHQLKPIARIIDVAWAGLQPEIMGLGPVHAAAKLLTRHQLQLNDLAAWEINEAFAAQVLACLAAFNDADFCRTELGLNSALGTLDPARLNQRGGAIALGHPVGASGARIVLQLTSVLKSKERGMASICIGGGLGGAMLIEKL